MMNDPPDTRQPGPASGLCAGCRHSVTVANDRDSLFVRCDRARTDPAFPKYPVLPVTSCRGYEPTVG